MKESLRFHFESYKKTPQQPGSSCSSPKLKSDYLDTSLAQLVTMQKLLTQQISQFQRESEGNRISVKGTLSKKTGKIRQNFANVLRKTAQAKSDFLNIKSGISNQLKYCLEDIKYECEAKVTLFCKSISHSRPRTHQNSRANGSLNQQLKSHLFSISQLKSKIQELELKCDEKSRENQNLQKQLLATKSKFVQEQTKKANTTEFNPHFQLLQTFMRNNQPNNESKLSEQSSRSKYKFTSEQRSYDKCYKRSKSSSKEFKNDGQQSHLPITRNKQQRFRSMSTACIQFSNDDIPTLPRPLRKEPLQTLILNEMNKSPIMTIMTEQGKQSRVDIGVVHCETQTPVETSLARDPSIRESRLKAEEPRLNQRIKVFSQFETVRTVPFKASTISKENMNIFKHKIGQAPSLRNSRVNAERSDKKGKPREKSHKKIKVFSVI